jgi:hypothetical protein
MFPILQTSALLDPAIPLNAAEGIKGPGDLSRRYRIHVDAENEAFFLLASFDPDDQVGPSHFQALYLCSNPCRSNTEALNRATCSPCSGGLTLFNRIISYNRRIAFSTFPVPPLFFSALFINQPHGVPPRCSFTKGRA